MFPVPDIEFTGHILQFGMSEGMLWVLFSTKPAEYHIMYDNKHFTAIANQLMQAKEQDQLVHVRVQDVQILDLDLLEEETPGLPLSPHPDSPS